MAKKPEATSSLTREQIIKMIKKVSKNSCLIGEQEITELRSVQKIRTGVPTIDYLLGGGISLGKLTILAGNPSACKSTTSMHILKSLINEIKASEQHKFVLWFDPENSWDPEYAKALGVDQDYVIIEDKIKVLEDAFERADELISMGFIAALVIDSLDGLIPRKQDDNSYGNTMGSQAGALAMHLPSLYSRMTENGITSIFIKQARVKMGVMSKGEIITFNGGKALRHFADTIFILKRMSNRNLSYTPIQIKAEKTRSARMGLTLQIPQGECGFDMTRDLVDLAIANNFIKVGGGGWIEHGGEKVQGVDNLLEKLKSSPEFLSQLRVDVYEKVIDVSSIVCESQGEILVDDGILPSEV